MVVCPWCEKEVASLIEHPMPDDDYIEICIECSLTDELAKEQRYSSPRLKTSERTYSRT